MAVNAGHYAHLTDTYQGEKGKLTLDFWPLDYHADTARKQFEQVKPMLKCFEHWFGPYPWYQDGCEGAPWLPGNPYQVIPSCQGWKDGHPAGT